MCVGGGGGGGGEEGGVVDNSLFSIFGSPP